MATAGAGPPPCGAAAYKKKDGVLSMSSDFQSVTWKPKAAGDTADGALTISVKDITNLQQTPANNPKVMLKILVQQPSQDPSGQSQQYVFSFTSGAGARAEADKIKDALSEAISTIKARASQTPAPTGGATSMAIAQAVSSQAPGSSVWLDDNQLRRDIELQQSLLRADPNLQRIFMESLRTKPESVTNAQFMSQFWYSRVHLLRAHAIEKNQTRGSYNVLSTLKPRVEDNVTRLNISKEQIQLIFNQHPLVKRVYDENVPKLTEQQFWSRFFQSRLFKKLRGERVTEGDATDPVLDKYLRADEFAGGRESETHVPHFIDLEGNEENHSQRRGNMPSFDMRPASLDKVPIIRTLNRMSEKILSNVAPIDRDPSAPIGMDEDTYKELQLRDLRGDETRERVLLNLRDQSRFFAGIKEAESADDSSVVYKDPDAVLNSLRSSLDQTFPDSNEGSFELGPLVEPDDDDESGDEDNKRPGRQRRKRQEPVGSKSSMASATVQVFDAIRERKAQSESQSVSETFGLPQTLYERVVLTHATTCEFLRQFWQAFLSGNPDRAAEIASLVESLTRAVDRINAVSGEAESARQTEVEKLKQHARDVMTATGRKIKPNLKGVEGGSKVVQQLMGPTLLALQKAIGEYQKAHAQQTKESMAVSAA